ncbi:MAG TPA: serine/threonine-protein kinase [Kofleriaceae bacterium]
MTKARGDDSLPSATAPTIQSPTSSTVGDPANAGPQPTSTDTIRASLPGYQVRELLGRGGMGEVVGARDERIGREVAIKRMLGATPGPRATERFLKEARIQARLEHPAIVPVHEVGRDAEDQPYFAMKRLTGGTLEDLLATSPSRQRLLRVFADVCDAIAFAHSHGVIHRDLKPANIAVGDFGEVYVLDWGLARALDERDALVVAPDLDSLDGMTRVGSVIGTPRYMAPEQARDASDVGLPADIYSLGATLFEILTSEPLRDSDAPAELEPSPAKRHPERGVPPELDALCVAALATDPHERPTASQLAERVELYLDGDRDLERRRGLAGEWLAKAHEALASDPVRRRAEAMQSAGRALALDPESRDAAQLVTRLMLEPTGQLPAELTAELASAEAAVQRRQSRVATMSYLAVAAFLLMASWNGLRSGALLAIVAAVASVMAAAAFRLSHRAARRSEMLGVAVGNALLAALLSRAFGPLILAPAVICVMAVSLTSYPQLIDRARLVIAILIISWVLPVALEAVGVLHSTWRVVDGEVISTSSLIQIGKISTTALLVGANVITIVVIGMFANALARSRRDAQRQVEIQAWHLRQLLPSA